VFPAVTTFSILQEALTMNTVKLEKMERSDYFVVVGVCKNTHCIRLNDRIDDIEPTTKPTAKHSQRTDVIELIETVLATLPVTDKANIYALDDWLGPDSAGNPATGRLFTEDVWDRCRKTNNEHRVRIFLPNLKGTVVAGLSRVPAPDGFVVAGKGCTDSFNVHWESYIADCGGLDVVFGDVFGGFETGIGPLLTDLMQRSLLRCKPVTYVVCAFSDRPYRVKGMNRIAIIDCLQNKWRNLVHKESCGVYMVQNVHMELQQNTMMYFIVEIVRFAVNVPGFRHHIEREVLVEDESSTEESPREASSSSSSSAMETNTPLQAPTHIAAVAPNPPCVDPCANCEISTISSMLLCEPVQDEVLCGDACNAKSTKDASIKEPVSAQPQERSMKGPFVWYVTILSRLQRAPKHQCFRMTATPCGAIL
jgi:hypothetical protein